MSGERNHLLSQIDRKKFVFNVILFCCSEKRDARGESWKGRVTNPPVKMKRNDFIVYMYFEIP